MSIFKRQHTAVNAIFMVLSAMALVAFVNMFSARFSARWDATDNNAYSVSDATKGMLANIDGTVAITAYFTEDLPGYLLVRNQEVRDMLAEFAAVSDGNVEVVFMDPSKNPDTEQAAQAAGIPTLQFNVVQKDAFQVTNGYLGLLVSYQDKQESIPVIQDATSLEYDVASAINRVTRSAVPVVGIAQASGAVPKEDMTRVRSLLEREYVVRDISMSKGDLIADDVDTLLLLAPTEPLSDGDAYTIDQFLMRGGSLLVLAEGTRINWDTFTAEPLEVGVGDLLAQYGVRLHNNLVLDVSNEFAGFRVGQSQFFAPYPFWVKIKQDGFNPDSGIVNKLESGVFPWASSVEVLDDALTDATTRVDLVRTTSQAWEQDGDWQLNPQQIPPPAQGSQKSFVLATLLSGHFESMFTKNTIPQTVSGEGRDVFMDATDAGRLVVVGDSDFMLDASASRFESNVVFFSNLVDALTTDGSLIAIRSKTVTDRPLTALSDAHKSQVRWGNVLGVPALFALYGLLRFMRRRRVGDF